MTYVNISIHELVIRAMKYIVHGFVVTIATFLIPENKQNIYECILIGIISATTFSIFELLSPSVGASIINGVRNSIYPDIITGGRIPIYFLR